MIRILINYLTFVPFFIFGYSPASEFYVPTFWNTVFPDSVPKRRHIKFRRRGITQKKEYNIHNMAIVGNQERLTCICIKLDCSVCVCLTQLFAGRDMYRIYYIKNNYMFRHFTLAILHNTCEISYPLHLLPPHCIQPT